MRQEGEMLGPRTSHGRIAIFALTALALLAASAQLPSAQARRAANEWAGTWSTDWGTMVLKQSGSSVTGTYTHDSGHITGTAAGLVLTGRWDEAPTRKGPRDAGTIKWTMAADLRTFSGTWTYDGGGGGKWVGTRSSPPTTTSTTNTTTTTSEDKTPPQVHAFASTRVRPGTRAQLVFSVKDDSGRAKVHATLYEGGAKVRSAVSALLQATGRRGTWSALLAADLKGPLFFCVWAEDAAGNKSARAPKSSCAWLSLLVRVERVSNGCGGSGWGETAEVTQNLLGNTSSYSDSNVNPLAKSYPVNFVEACNLHDAGYGGQTVEDVIRGGVVDFRTWSRRQVDRKFWADMRLLCLQQIPATATTARANCRARGGNVSVGAESRYNFVREWGHKFFDADLTVPGMQEAGSSSSRPWGGVRNNG